MRYLTKLGVLCLVAFFSAVSHADAVKSKGWLVGVGVGKSITANYNDSYTSMDLDADRLKLNVEYKADETARYGFDFSNIKYKLNNTSEDVVAQSYSFTIKGIARNGKVKPYLGTKLGFYVTSDLDADENTLGFGVNIGVGALVNLSNNLELDLGIDYNTVIMEQVTYCSYGYYVSYCSSVTPIIYDFNVGLGLNYHF